MFELLLPLVGYKNSKQNFQITKNLKQWCEITEHDVIMIMYQA